MEIVSAQRTSIEKRSQYRIGLVLVCLALTLVACNNQPDTDDLWNTPSLNWQTLPSLPDEHGFAGGYAGTLETKGTSYLLFAGGANFPNGFPWQGGKKHWYSDIYLFDGATEWKNIGNLPDAAGYGLSISHKGTMYLIGGNYQDAEATDKVYRLTLNEEGLQTRTLPPLPQATFNLCGAIVGETIYVAGGTDGTGTLGNFWSMNVERPQDGWQKLPTWPGSPRMLAIAGVLNDEFYLIGGVELVPSGDTSRRHYLSDAYAYSESGGWRRIADMPTVKAASPSPAISLSRGQRLIVLSGSDGSLDGQTNTLLEKHPGFPPENYIYDLQSDRWQLHSVMPKVRGHLTPTGRDGVWPSVTSTSVLWQGGVVVPSGEIKPGVRTPKILFGTLTD